MLKATLRRHLRTQLGSLDRVKHETASAEICRRILKLTAYEKAAHILVFIPLPEEPDILPVLLNAFDKGKQVSAPCFNAGKPDGLRRITSLSELIAHGRLRQPDPATAQETTPDQIEVALVPGLGFDTAGNRLGRGGGYYDRLLPFLPPYCPRVAIAFSCQLLEVLPRDPWDQTVDTLITEATPEAGLVFSSGGGEKPKPRTA